MAAGSAVTFWEAPLQKGNYDTAAGELKERTLPPLVISLFSISNKLIFHELGYVWFWGLCQLWPFPRRAKGKATLCHGTLLAKLLPPAFKIASTNLGG